MKNHENESTVAGDDVSLGSLTLLCIALMQDASPEQLGVKGRALGRLFGADSASKCDTRKPKIELKMFTHSI